MGIEIERRFFVKEGFHPQSITDDRLFIYQTYLMGTGDWALRGRKTIVASTCEHQYEVTLKRGVSAVESKEITIPTNEFGYNDFVSECLEPIKKTRYLIPQGDLKFEVDVFLECFSGHPFVAEIELPHIDHPIDLPEWVGEEITGRKGYSNFAMFRRMHGIKKK